MITIVTCYAGYTYPERPQHFTIGDDTYDVDEVISEWVEPDRKRFLVHTSCFNIFELEYLICEDTWNVSCR